MNNPSIRAVVFDALRQQYRKAGVGDEQILQEMRDMCPCDDCRQKRGLPPKERFMVPCPHESGIPGRHPDYYPLDKSAIVNLVSKAFRAINEGDHWTSNSILCRLGQAIPGQVCPREAGHAEEVETRLDRYWVDNLKFYGADPTFAEEIWNILHS